MSAVGRAPGRPKPAGGNRETRLPLMASKPAKAGSEPRHSLPLGAEPGHGQSGGLPLPGEGLGSNAGRGLQDRSTYSSNEGLQ